LPDVRLQLGDVGGVGVPLGGADLDPLRGHVHLRQVRLGEANEQNEIEVMAGLNVGERVAREAVKAGMVATESKR
jgi:hypothetical protein